MIFDEILYILMQKPLKEEQPVELFIPQLKEEDKISCYAQLRPYREGGPRVEKELLWGKHIFHNYGHGGAGISLAPATSHQAVNLAADFLSTASPVAVIGSGIMGLLTAYFLKQRFKQVKVSIYAQSIPKLGNKDNNTMIASEIAPGEWLPFDYGLNNQNQHNRMADFAYEWYQNLKKQQKFKDVIREVEVFTLSDTGKYEYQDSLTKALKPSSRWVTVMLNGKVKVKAHVITTLKIDLQPFLNLLIQGLVSKGVNFVTKFISRDNLKDLSELVVFNCTGLGSKELFGDTKLKGVKVYIIEYKNRMPEVYKNFIEVSMNSKEVQYYMHPTRILVGRVVEYSQNREVDPGVVQGLLTLHQKFMKLYGLSVMHPLL